MNKIEPSGQTNKNTKQSLGMCKIRCRMPNIKIKRVFKSVMF